MSSLDFPLNPVDSQEYSLNGVTYYYNAALGAWLTKLSSAPLPTAFNRQVLFNDAGLSNGSYGLVFDKSANTLFANTINVSSNMRVTGNLYIGSNTVTITDTAVMARSLFVMNDAGHMTSVPSGSTSNLAFDTANAAYAAANNVGPQIAPAYNTANLAFDAANNVAPQVTPAFNTANAAFGVANTALQNTSGTFAGNLTVTGTANVNGSLYVTNISHINTYTINYLIVAGGGGGGGSISGGGGGGGAVTGTANVVTGSTFAASIGAGGPSDTNGSNSTLGNFTVAIGGGTSPGYGGDGYSGGSGGGGARSTPGSVFYMGGTPTWQQGNAGGCGSNTGGSDNYGSGGGGGGAGGRGQDAQGSYAGNGGQGIKWLNGSVYAGGGGGGAYNGNGGRGGPGGGGAGTGSNSTGAAGTTNTGGGGGSGGYSAGGAPGGAGGSGIVIVAYLGSQRGTGGTVSSSGGYTYHTFTTSGTFTA